MLRPSQSVSGVLIKSWALQKEKKEPQEGVTKGQERNSIIYLFIKHYF